jgi:hypothetical protein
MQRRANKTPICPCKVTKLLENATSRVKKATAQLATLREEFKITDVLCIVCNRNLPPAQAKIVNVNPRKHICFRCINELATPGNDAQTPAQYLAAHVIVVAPDRERGHPAPKRVPSDSKCVASDPVLITPAPSRRRRPRHAPSNVRPLPRQNYPSRAYNSYHEPYNHEEELEASFRYDGHEHDDHHQNEEGMADYCRNDGQGRY